MKIITYVIFLSLIFSVYAQDININPSLNVTDKKVISVEEAISKIKSNGRVISVELKEEEIKVQKGVRGFIGTTKLVYNIRTVEERKALALIPTSMNVDSKVDAETGEVISVVKPWWSFLTEIFKF